MSDIGSKIHQRRRELGLTLREVQALSGVHLSHLGRCERGERFPSAKTLRKLAKPLHFAEIELLFLAGYLSGDGFDDLRKHLRQELKDEVARSMHSLEQKIENILG